MHWKGLFPLSAPVLFHVRKATRSKYAFAGRIALAIVVFLAVAGFAAIAIGDFYGRSLPFVPAAMQAVNGSGAAKDALGETIGMRWPIEITAVSSADGAGHVTLSIPVRGTRGDGTLNIRALERTGVWSTEELSLNTSDTHPAIPLKMTR